MANTQSYSFKLCDVKFKVSLENIDSIGIRKPTYQGFHYHAEHELFFALNEPIVINTAKGPLEYQNQLVAIPPHYDHVASVRGNFKLLFTFKPMREQRSDFCNFLISAFGSDDIALLKPGERTSSLLFELIRSFRCDLDIADEMTISALKLLFSDIYISNEYSAKRKAPKGTESYLLKIDNIVCCYNKDITLASVAKLLGICPRHASRIIKSNYGATLSEIVEKKRLNVARELLIKGNMSIGEIVEYVNFPSASYFYARFKKIYGTTPSKYRKENSINS